MVVGGVEKSHVKFFATDVQKYSCVRPTQSITSSLIDVHDRFSPQSFKHHLDPTIIKMLIHGLMYTIVNSRKKENVFSIVVGILNK